MVDLPTDYGFVRFRAVSVVMQRQNGMLVKVSYFIRIYTLLVHCTIQIHIKVSQMIRIS